jgi:hypothetical protein
MTIRLNKTGNKIDMNDFFLLSDGTLGGKTIKRNSLMDGDFIDMKLTNISNKFLTMVDNDEKSNKVILKSRRTGARQALSYNAQGELITDGKCLTYSNETEPVFFGECTDTKKQKWHMYDNKISPQYDNNKCLTSEKDSVYVKQCKNDDNQTWTSGGTDDTDASDYVWDKYHGKTVVLVESNNPWYVNTDQTVRLENIYSGNHISDDVGYRNNADFKSRFIMDPNGHHLGYGASYADRQGESCDKIEQFNGTVNEDNQIIFMMLCLLFTIIVYKVWNK